jgi:hypothetical protein
MTIEIATEEVVTALESLELAVASLCDEMAAWKALTGEEPKGRLLEAALASLEFASKEQDNALAETSDMTAVTLLAAASARQAEVALKRAVMWLADRRLASSN